MEHTNTNTEVQASQGAVAIEASDTSTATPFTTDSLHTSIATGSDDEPEPCPACGARVMHQSHEQDKDEWLGIGEKERCHLCGADYEHSAPWNKKPLSEWTVTGLLNMAQEVDRAYDVSVGKRMTQEQVNQNREYFKRLVTALAAANPHHIEDRVEKFAAKERRLALCIEAAKLFDELSTTSITGRTFIKYLSGDYSLDDLTQLVSGLKREVAEAKAA